MQVKDAVALYPLLPFLALRFAIATLALAAPGYSRVRTLGRRGAVAAAVAGGLLALGYTLQTLGRSSGRASRARSPAREQPARDRGGDRAAPSECCARARIPATAGRAWRSRTAARETGSSG